MKKEILKIIKDGENENIEFKRDFADEVIISLVAFANFKGGKVLLGVGDNGKIAGVKINKESIQKWANEIKNKTQPYLNVNAYQVNFKNKIIIIFEVLEFPLKPVSFKNRYYIRKNNSNHILSLQDVAEMYLRTKNSSWDFYADKDADLDKLNQDKISQVKAIIEENLSISLGDNLSFLRKYSLIVEEDGNEYPSFASMLLFSKKPLRQTDIQIGLFQTDTIIKKSKIIRNDLIAEVEEVMDFIESYILKEYVFTGKPRREEKWQYPITALREIVINAIVHRDYREGAHSQFRVYPDKLIFWNIGKLPYDLSLENIKRGTERSCPRNKLVAEIFRDCGLIERYGSGIKKAIDQFREHGLKGLDFKEVSGGFEVAAFSKEFTKKDVGKDVGKDKRKQIIINKIKSKKKFTYISLAKEIGVTEKTIERDLKDLKKDGKIKFVGTKRAGHWELL